VSDPDRVPVVSTIARQKRLALEQAIAYITPSRHAALSAPDGTILAGGVLQQTLRGPAGASRSFQSFKLFFRLAEPVIHQRQQGAVATSAAQPGDGDCLTQSLGRPTAGVQPPIFGHGKFPASGRRKPE